MRSESYNSGSAEPGPDGQPLARLTLGLESVDGMSAADILHVRQGKNYLVTDFVRMDRLRDDPAGMDILAQVFHEIGFDFVRVYEQHGDRVQLLPNVPFAEWDNPYFSAAQYYGFLHECYPLPKDNELRAGQTSEIVQYIQRDEKASVSQLKLAVATLATSFSDNAAVQGLAKSQMEELTQCWLGKIPEPLHQNSHWAKCLLISKSSGPICSIISRMVGWNSATTGPSAALSPLLLTGRIFYLPTYPVVREVAQ